MSTSIDRYARIGALKPARRSLTPPHDDMPRGHVPDIPAGAERLAQILGAMARENRFGPHLGLRRWFSEVIDGDAALESKFDLAALRLIAPEAPDCVADPLMTGIFVGPKPFA